MVIYNRFINCRKMLYTLLSCSVSVHSSFSCFVCYLFLPLYMNSVNIIINYYIFPVAMWVCAVFIGCLYNCYMLCKVSVSKCMVCLSRMAITSHCMMIISN